MYILVLSSESQSDVEQALAALEGVRVGRSLGDSQADPQCVIIEAGSCSEIDLPEAWKAQLVGQNPVLLITEQSTDYPSLPPQAVSPVTLPHAITWARQHHQMKRDSQDIVKRSREIMAHVTHELRSPLTVISLATQLAMRSDLPQDKLNKHLKMVSESSKVLQSLVNDILDYSKTTTGAIELSNTEFDFLNLISNISESYRLLAEEKGVQLNCEQAQGLPQKLIGDPGRLRQILANLLSNSIKFTSEGAVHLKISVNSSRSRRVDLNFQVQDSGIGIAEEAMTRIFEAYEQATAGTYHQFGGTGLGLTIARSLVRQMGGEISVHSIPTKGSTFTFNISLLKAQSLRLATKLREGLHGLPALLIQKNDDTRRKLCQELSSWGCDVWSTGSRTAALRLAPTASSGVVILDLDDWGLGLVEDLRRQPGLEKTHIVVIVSVGQRGDAALCQKLGVGAYLAGVLEMQVLRQALQLTVSRRHALVTRHTVREANNPEERSDSVIKDQVLN